MLMYREGCDSLSDPVPLRSRSAEELFAGPGEIRALGRLIDWAATPLGPVERWPQSLRSTVRTLLSSQYPMVLTWGGAFTQIYNDAYSKLIGDRHPAGLGNDIRITLAEAWDTLGPMIDRVMRTGLANWTAALPLEMHRSGYREEAYFSVSHAPAEDDDGNIVGMLAVCSEVTEQLVSERRLRLLRELGARAGEAREPAEAARDLVETMAEHPLDVPFAAIYLCEGDELIRTAAVGIPEHSVAAPHRMHQGAGAVWPVAAALRGQVTPVDDVQTLVPLVGGPYADPVRCALVLPITGAQGTALGVIIAGVSPNRSLDEGYRSFFELLAGQVSVAMRNARAREDERRRAEELAELDRAKTAFFSNVSHEFRTPLTLLLGPLEDALADSPDRLPAHRGELEMAHRNALRLLRLVNALLDFSRVEADRAEASFELVDLAALTADLSSNFRSAMEKAGLDFTVDVQPLPRPVAVDRSMYETIVLNLLSNTFKFTHQGSVRVRLAGLDDGVGLTVTDTGEGVAAEELPRLFERFHRIEGQNARSHEGSGIGLALVQKLVQLHGGTISAESEGPGRGATFRVILPYGRTIGDTAVSATASTRADAYVEEALRWLPGESVASRASLPAARPHLLLADDNADMRAYVERLLRDDYEVTAVANGTEALAAAKRIAPDLVLSDIMMPGLDGFALLRELRADPATAAVPIIFLSARAGEEARVESLEAGADDHIVKPFNAQELRARVAGAIRLADLRGEAASRERVLEAKLATSQAKAALADSEEQLRMLADALPVLITHVDKDLRYRFVNRTFEQWFGRRREHVIGQSVFDVVDPEALAQGRANIDGVLAGEHLSFEQELIFPDGVRRIVQAEYLPQLTSDEQTEGFYSLVQDVSATREQARLLADNERRMRTVLEAVSDGFYAIDADWRLILFNRAAERHFDRSRDEVLGRVMWDVFPEVVGTPFEDVLRRTMIDRVESRQEMRSVLKPDRFVEIRTAPKEGGGIAVSFSDVTERKEAERHRELLVNELNHRVKNTLAVVQSLAVQSFRDERVPDHARRAFEGRLLALSDAHNLLTRESWASAPLRQIIENALRPFGGANRFDYAGPDLRIGSKASVSLALALHELCTNAAKYGALSQEGGRARIDCSVEQGEPPVFHLRWEEQGGPSVMPPSGRGFGSRLIERGLAAEIGGIVRLRYPPTGVVCEIEAPLPNMEGQE